MSLFAMSFMGVMPFGNLLAGGRTAVTTFGDRAKKYKQGTALDHVIQK